MKFLVDADLPNSTVEPFKEEGFKATHVREIGLGREVDRNIADYAN